MVFGPGSIYVCFQGSEPCWLLSWRGRTFHPARTALTLTWFSTAPFASGQQGKCSHGNRSCTEPSQHVKVLCSQRVSWLVYVQCQLGVTDRLHFIGVTALSPRHCTVTSSASLHCHFFSVTALSLLQRHCTVTSSASLHCHFFSVTAHRRPVQRSGAHTPHERGP